MILDATTKSIQVKLGEAISSNNLDVTAAYADITTTSFTPIENDTTTNGTTAVTVVAAPSSSTQRDVKEIRIHNNDTINHTIILQYNNNSTLRVLQEQTITPGSDFLYAPGNPPTTSAAGQIAGTATNDNAAAGNVGEYISSSVGSGSAVNLTSATAANITSITLTPGDWDVDGLVCFSSGSSTSYVSIQGWISTSSATVPTEPNSGAEFFFYFTSAQVPGSGLWYVSPVGRMRISVSSNTTVYLSAKCTYSSSTPSAYGFIGARRRR